MNNKGFTLIELLLTIALLAILVTTTIPSLTTLIQDKRDTSQMNDLITAAQRARSESIKRGIPVTLCSSDDHSSCNSGDGAANWASGWMIFSDADASEATVSSSEIIAVSAGINDAPLSSTGTGVIRFAPTGSSSGLCVQNQKYKVNIDLSGGAFMSPRGDDNANSCS